MGVLSQDRDHLLCKGVWSETYKGLSIRAVLASHGGLIVVVLTPSSHFNLWTGSNVLEARRWVDKFSEQPKGKEHIL